MPPDDAIPASTPETPLPPAKPMPSVTTLTQMVANPNIPGDLMANTQKQLSQISAMSAQIREAQKRAQTEMETVLDNEAANIKSQGAQGVNTLYDANRMLQIVSPEQTAIYLDKRNAYQRFHDATANWTPETTYAQMQTDLEQLSPIHAPVNSPAFATHVEMYEAGQKKALEMEKIREQRQKSVENESSHTLAQMTLPDSMRPQGVPKLTDDWLKMNANKMSGDDVHKAEKWLAGGAEYSDRGVRTDLINRSLYEDPQTFRNHAEEAYANKRITAADLDHTLNLNKDAQNDAGVKFIRDAMDTKLLGANPYMQSSLSSMREKVIQTYLAEKAAHPEWKDSDRLNAAMQLEHDNQITDMGNIHLSLSLTPAMRNVGIHNRNDLIQLKPEDARAKIMESEAWMRSETQAGRTTQIQRDNQAANADAWLGYFDYLIKNRDTKKVTADKLKAAK